MIVQDWNDSRRWARVLEQSDRLSGFEGESCNERKNVAGGSTTIGLSPGTFVPVALGSHYSGLGSAVSMNSGIIRAIVGIKVGWQLALPMQFELAIRFYLPGPHHVVSARNIVSLSISREADHTDRTGDIERDLRRSGVSA